MINERLKKRLKKDRPSTTITMRIPTDLVESLKAVAPMRGFTAYPGGFVHTPCSVKIKSPRTGLFIFTDGGEGGIRTHVPELPDHPISSRRRYDHFGTSPLTNVPRANSSPSAYATQVDDRLNAHLSRVR